jgi:diamine N-acetyltransferase
MIRIHGEIKGMNLREANETDIPIIVELEHAPGPSQYVSQWTREEHNAAMCNPDTRYFIAEDNSNMWLGYAILCGLQSEHRNIELKRIVMRSPGQGHGRQMLQMVLRKAFEEFKAHRVWLDVFEANLRAQHLYRSFGFQQDGILREAVCRAGKYHSLLLMSLLDREYRTVGNS